MALIFRKMRIIFISKAPCSWSGFMIDFWKRSKGNACYIILLKGRATLDNHIDINKSSKWARFRGKTKPTIAITCTTDTTKPGDTQCSPVAIPVCGFWVNKHTTRDSTHIERQLIKPLAQKAVPPSWEWRSENKNKLFSRHRRFGNTGIAINIPRVMLQQYMETAGDVNYAYSKPQEQDLLREIKISEHWSYQLPLCTPPRWIIELQTNVSCPMLHKKMLSILLC